MKTVVYLGAKPIGLKCLEALLDSEAEVLAIGCPSTDKIVNVADDMGVPLLVDLEDIPACDFIISVQYNKILRQQHINKASKLAVNLHLAPLPEYRGCNQFSYAIFNSEERFGVTLHVMDEGVDSGDILFESRFDIPLDIWVEELHALSTAAGEELFRRSLEPLLGEQYSRIPQSTFKGVRPGGFYLRKDIEKLKRIDFSEPLEMIERRIRATAMPGFAPPYAEVLGRKIQFAVVEDE